MPSAMRYCKRYAPTTTSPTHTCQTYPGRPIESHLKALKRSVSKHEIYPSTMSWLALLGFFPLEHPVMLCGIPFSIAGAFHFPQIPESTCHYVNAPPNLFSSISWYCFASSLLHSWRTSYESSPNFQDLPWCLCCSGIQPSQI